MCDDVSSRGIKMYQTQFFVTVTVLFNDTVSITNITKRNSSFTALFKDAVSITNITKRNYSLLFLLYLRTLYHL
jgi:hypothetical protein